MSCFNQYNVVQWIWIPLRLQTAGQKAHIYITRIYLTIGPQISLYFHPPRSCTAGLHGHEDKDPHFHCRYICDHWPWRYSIILHCWTRYLWELKVYIYITHIYLTIGPQISPYFSYEDKYPRFHCRYICGHCPSMYFIFSHCWTRRHRGQKAHIYTSRIYLTIGPQISLYFHPSPSCTTD